VKTTTSSIIIIIIKYIYIAQDREEANGTGMS